MSDLLVEIRGVRMESMPDSVVSNVVKIPTLQVFRIGGSAYDPVILDQLRSRIYLNDVRVAGRTLDEQLSARLPDSQVSKL